MSVKMFYYNSGLQDKKVIFLSDSNHINQKKTPADNKSAEGPLGHLVNVLDVLKVSLRAHNAVP